MRAIPGTEKPELLALPERDVFCCLVKPERQLPAPIARLTGLTQSELRQGGQHRDRYRDAAWLYWQLSFGGT